jgi:hypothetical protein
VDSAIFGEATGKHISIGGQVFSDWFGHIKRHPVLLRAIAQPEVSQHTGELGKYTRQSALGEICMPKHYTLAPPAADVEAALRLLEGRWKLIILFHLLGGKVMPFRI